MHSQQQSQQSQVAAREMLPTYEKEKNHSKSSSGEGFSKPDLSRPRATWSNSKINLPIFEVLSGWSPDVSSKIFYDIYSYTCICKYMLYICDPQNNCYNVFSAENSNRKE